METSLCASIFFFNDTATTEIYTLSLHDALPIFQVSVPWFSSVRPLPTVTDSELGASIVALAPLAITVLPSSACLHRHRTRLHSSHGYTSSPGFSLENTRLLAVPPELKSATPPEI